MSLVSKKMRAFILVARYKSVSEAARALSLTASPVSRLITEFESFCNRKLFDRKGNKLALTPDGERVYEELNDIYSLLSQFEQELKGKSKKTPEYICYDWGKEHYVYHFYERFMGFSDGGEYNFSRVVSFPVVNLDINTFYFISEDVRSDCHRTYIKRQSDTLCFYYRQEGAGNVSDKPLIMYRDQNAPQALRRNIENVRRKYMLGQVVMVNNERTAFEIIRNGYGVGIETQGNISAAARGLHDIQIIDTGICVPFYLKVPEGARYEKAMQQLTALLGDFILLDT